METEISVMTNNLETAKNNVDHTLKEIHKTEERIKSIKVEHQDVSEKRDLYFQCKDDGILAIPEADNLVKHYAHAFGCLKLLKYVIH